MPLEIKIYNTLKHKKEKLEPIKEGHVGIYACGVTVYDESHIGHAMQAIFFDVIRTYLEYIGYQVNYVRNYTDVDDKIIKRAQEKNISPRKLADNMIQETKKDMAALGVSPATTEPLVSENINEIIEMISQLVEKKAAYVTNDGDVYYRVRMKKDYGKLSNRKPDELRSGSRDINKGQKEDELDFALWKKDTTPDASWPSPWGIGRPGWHIECSVMARKYLGNSFDIHGGGRDLVFPHHENEIAQSESANNCPYASIWIHSGLMTLNKQKMSKSLGNTITIKDFLKDWHPEVLRISILQNHYSSNIDFSNEIFLRSRRRLFYYYKTVQQLEERVENATRVKAEDVPELEKFKEQFITSMSDDFNSAKAIAVLNNLLRKANQFLSSKAKNNPNLALSYLEVIRELSSALGLLQSSAQNFLQVTKEKELEALDITEEEINNAIQKRNEARLNKNYQMSDQIREQLLEKNIVLEDSPKGTDWNVINLAQENLDD